MLHAGLMKTGTTALQSAASDRRRTLLRRGVRYPGRHYNHRNAAVALFARDSDSSRHGPDDWDKLMAEINADRHRRILISNEMIGAADESTVRRFRDELGPTTHVVFTVRSFAALLPSLWQQYVKSGHRGSFDEFLARRLTDDAVEQPSDMAKHDQAAIVSRWVDVFGSENVTVVVVDKSDPHRVSTSFEALLDLPDGLLHQPSMSGMSVNRSLSVHEASLLLTVNRLLDPHNLDRADVDRLVFNGAANRMLDECPRPSPDDELILPPWAVGPAVARSLQYAETIAASGVRVVGDLDELGRQPATGRGRWKISTTVPVEVAAEAVVGAMSAGLNRGSNFGLPAGVRPRTREAFVANVRGFAGDARRRLGRLRSTSRSG